MANTMVDTLRVIKRDGMLGKFVSLGELADIVNTESLSEIAFCASAVDTQVTSLVIATIDDDGEVIRNVVAEFASLATLAA